jgi:hypothetical protein
MKEILILAFIFLIKINSFGQLAYMRGFKNLGDDSYLLTFKDPVEAIHKYNYVLDMNGMDTSKVYDITKNPIDFGFFKKDPNSDKVIMCFFLKKDKKYDLLFGEIEDENTYFFDVVDENGDVTELKYIKSE